MEKINILIMLCALSCASLDIFGKEKTPLPPDPSLLKNDFVVSAENIFENPPFNECHSSTILETKDGGLIVAYFAGTKEGNDDVCIWLSRQKDGKWLEPRKIISSEDSLGKRVACWNPVLFRPKTGEIILFFKQNGPCTMKNGEYWEGWQSVSTDEGETWSKPTRLVPNDNLGPIKNKPVYVGDRVIAPSSDEFSPSDWRVFFLISDDHCKTWKRTQHIPGGIQPSILVYPDGRLQAVGRTPPHLAKKGQGYIYETWSLDNGQTWSPLSTTGLPNPCSATDALTLMDGRQLLVYNHSNKKRTPLNLAISDNGANWYPVLTIVDKKNEGEFSYPAIIQRSDGTVDITYTNRRKCISHVSIDPTKIHMQKKPMFHEWK